MKYCVSGRQPKSILSQADEIKLNFIDNARLIDYVHDYPEKTVILNIPKDVKAEEINWEIYKEYSNLIMCIADLGLAGVCNLYGIPFYWSYPAFTWYDLRGLIDLGPCYIMLAAPLSFSLEKIKRITDIPLRICPNLAYDAYIPHENGIYGTWVRPEDIGIYDEYIDTFEFIGVELSQEATLLHVYKDNGNWPGNLNILFQNFDIDVDNRAIPEEIGQFRANCGQRCMETSNCHFCETAMKFSNALRKKHYQDNKIAPMETSEEN